MQRLRVPAIRTVLPYLYILVLVLGVAVVHMDRYQELSPIDELRHVDYAERVAKFDFPKLGDKLHQPAMRLEACRGVELGPDYREPRCDSRRFSPSDFRDEGFQNATFHPPTYYLGAGLTARVVNGLGLSQDALDPMRLFSALLIAAGLMVAYAAGRVAGLRAVVLLPVVTTAVATEGLLHASATVNPDSTAVLCGALALLVALLWERGRLSLWTLGAVGALATATKLTNFLGIAIVAGWLLVRSVSDESLERWRVRLRLPERARVGSDGAPTTTAPVDDGARPSGARDYRRAAVVLVGAALAVAAAWTIVDQLRATIEPLDVPQNLAFAADGFPRVHEVLQPANVFAFFPPVGGYSPVRFHTEYWLDARTMITYLWAGGLLFASARFRRDDRLSVLAFVGTLLMIVGGPVFVVLQVVFNDILNTASSRYGLSALPFALMAVAYMARSRLGTIGCWVIGTGSVVALLAAMI